MTVAAGVAAHHPATAAAGLELLAAGGSAADAAVGAALSACVVESYMTGLAGGGHAITWDAATGTASTWDFFVAVPGLGGHRATHSSPPVVVDIVFEAEPVPYTVGPPSVGVHGVPAGLEAVWKAAGRLGWSAVVEPALRLAERGCRPPPTHATVLQMIAPLMTLSEGARIYAPGGRLLTIDDDLLQPGLAAALRALRDEGAESFYRGSVAKLILELMADTDSLLDAEDLEAYEVVRRPPEETTYAGCRVLARHDLEGMLATLARLEPLRGLDPGARALALVRALAGPDVPGHTTNVAAVDPRGNACVITTSLGLGSGDWVPGLDFQLNSMLGEVDLLRGDTAPGARLGSMMAPTIVLDDGLVLAAGAAGGSRIRSALVQTLSGVLDEGLTPSAAVEQARLHVTASGVVHTEPGFAPEALTALEGAGLDVRRWRTRHHYFGGVSVVARRGVAADSRRDGAALMLDDLRTDT